MRTRARTALLVFVAAPLVLRKTVWQEYNENITSHRPIRESESAIWKCNFPVFSTITLQQFVRILSQYTRHNASPLLQTSKFHIISRRRPSEPQNKQIYSRFASPACIRALFPHCLYIHMSKSMRQNVCLPFLALCVQRSRDRFLCRRNKEPAKKIRERVRKIDTARKSSKMYTTRHTNTEWLYSAASNTIINFETFSIRL